MGSTAVGGLATTRKLDLADLDGQVIAVDAYIELHQFIHSITDDYGDYVRNEEGQPISHLIGFVSRLGNVLNAGIKPVYVFDGGYDPLKEEELARRSNPDATEKFEQAKANGNKSKAYKYAHQKAHVSDFIVDSSKELLQAMGIPTLHAPGEAEPQAAQLVSEGTANHVASQDWDTLLYDVPTMVRDMKSNGAKLVLKEDILNKTGWTNEQLRWYAIVRGTDYNKSAYGVGKVRGKRIINNAESFEEVMDEADSYGGRTIDRDRWRRVLDLFDEQEVIENWQPEFGTFNLDNVHEIACLKYGLADWQVQSRMKNVKPQ